MSGSGPSVDLASQWEERYCTERAQVRLAQEMAVDALCGIPALYKEREPALWRSIRGWLDGLPQEDILTLLVEYELIPSYEDWLQGEGE